MSDMGIRASTSASILKIPDTKVISEKLRVRDLTNAVHVNRGVRRTEEAKDTHSPLDLWTKEESPFSHRHLMTHGADTTRKKTSEPSIVDELSMLRSKFTADGYKSILDVVATIHEIMEQIEGGMPLSKLTVREKNSFQEDLGLYEEHFKRILEGFSNATFSQDVKVIIERVKKEITQILEKIEEVNLLIKIEIRPSLADINRLRV